MVRHGAALGQLEKLLSAEREALQLEQRVNDNVTDENRRLREELDR